MKGMGGMPKENLGYHFSTVCFLLRVWSRGPHPLPFSRPHEPQAMSEMWQFCVWWWGGAKPRQHPKGAERCYLVSELSLCLPYISAPKPPPLQSPPPVNQREKEPVAEGRGR